MIIGIGVDLEDVSRIEESLEKFGERFMTRVFTEGEILFCRGKSNEKERFAARFAAKEAAFKSIQGDWTLGLTWKDFELVVKPGGAPQMLLHGGAAKLAESKGVKRMHVSFSHTKTHVTAMVVAEGD